MNTLTQSSDRQAGTTPLVPTSPRVGLSPTIPFSAAGTRPEPAVSVPSANDDQAGRDRDRAARAGPAGDQVAAEHALAAPVRGAGAGQAGGELVQVGLADDDRAGVEQPAHAVRVPGRGVAERRAGRGGGQPGDVDVVLDRERDAEQRRQLGAVRAASGRLAARRPGRAGCRRRSGRSTRRRRRRAAIRRQHGVHDLVRAQQAAPVVRAQPAHTQREPAGSRMRISSIVDGLVSATVPSRYGWVTRLLRDALSSAQLRAPGRCGLRAGPARPAPARRSPAQHRVVAAGDAAARPRSGDRTWASRRMLVAM